MKNKKILMILLMIAPLLMVLAVYSKLPTQVPMHWGIDGSIDRYGNKRELFRIAGINIIMGGMFYFLPKIDPKGGNYKRFQGAYDWMVIWTLGFMTVIMGVTLAETMQPGRFEITKVICAMMAILFISLGNMMPKVKRNFFTGVKTPWALSSDAVWNKTQRLGGKFFVFGGILMLICALCFSPMVAMIMTITVAIGICLVPTVMSYIWYQKELKETVE